MITIFACPKSFQEETDTVQRNAIKSWSLLEPKPEIILMGDDAGVVDISKEFNALHIPNIERNEYNTPLVNSLFSLAEKTASNQVLCYVNSDIILTSDFIKIVRYANNQRDKALFVGRRWDVDIDKSVNLGESGWEDSLKSYVVENGTLHAPTGIDYFIFSKGTFSDIPPFALGRTIWDSWFVYRARSEGIPVIDATGIIWAIHQNHNYPSNLGGVKGIWTGLEAKRNSELFREPFYNISNATYLMLSDGLLYKRTIFLHVEPFIIIFKKLIKYLRNLLSS